MIFMCRYNICIFLADLIISEYSIKTICMSTGHGASANIAGFYFLVVASRN